ncbi:helix-turn-helix domain-containing protein [Microbulbifer sp. SSSA002]|uniref:helix-turn-helix domain-containing protein n=1 Tax=unclassified Microbulbifer TaxID=2619833 RepID=UPI00403A0889
MRDQNKNMSGHAGVPKIFAPYFVVAAARLGIPAERLIEQLPFSFSWHPEESEWLNYSEFNALIESILALSPVTSPGLSFSRFPIMLWLEETIIEAQPSLRRPREIFRPAEIVLSQTLAPFLRFQTYQQADAEVLTLSWQQELFSARVNHFIAEMLMSRAVDLLRTLNPRFPEVQGLKLRGEKPEDDSIHQRIFQCPIEFSADENAVILAPQTLDFPIPSYHKLLRNQSRNILKAVLHNTLSSYNLAASLRAWLEKHLLDEEITIKQAAAHFRTSGRTLQRRLREQGVTFQQLKDSVTLSLTKQLLLSTKDSVESIAVQLHFAERAVFTRFFKKHEGVTPSEFRRSNVGRDAFEA